MSVYIATSLDGFIARPDGGIDWLPQHGGWDEQEQQAGATPQQQEDYGYRKFMDSVDAILMGRNSYEKVLSFGIEWPYPKPTFVLSTTLTNDDVPAELKGKVTMFKSPEALLQHASGDAKCQHLYVDGGSTVQNFLKQRLIDQIIITRIPVLIGKGIPLFGPLGDGDHNDAAHDVNLVHVSTQSWPNGMVQSTYRVPDSGK